MRDACLTRPLSILSMSKDEGATAHFILCPRAQKLAQTSTPRYAILSRSEESRHSSKIGITPDNAPLHVTATADIIDRLQCAGSSAAGSAQRSGR